MYSKNNKKMIIQKEQEKINYYGIKKFNVGTASVLIAAGFAFLGGGSALASNDASATITNTETVNNNVTATKEEVSTTTPAKANKTNLSAAIARVQEAIAKAGVSEKTASAIEDVKVELVTAQALEVSEVATQGEVDRATVALKNKAFVLESMKKSTAKEVDKPTEEKVNKNQDPRNGQAIPGKGESGFRDTGTVADGTENPVVVNTNDITQKASELEAEIAKVESLISAENAKREGKKDKEFIEILTQVKESAQAVKNKGSNIPTTEKEKHALLQELKAKVDLLKLYQAKKLDWGAPANNHLANYGNNPTNAIISNLNDTFGTPDFSVSDSHEKVVENQRNGLSGTILGSAKYHWKEKNISVSDAIAGALDGWKIVDKPGKNIVTLVKPEQPTDIQRQNGATEREYNPNSAKVYDNKGKANMDGQGAPNSSGKLLNTMIITPKIEAPEAGSGTVNKDFYLELRKQGTTIYKDFDVNPNSHLYAHLLYAGAYGKLALASTGEKVKLKIVDAYTGAPLSELKREDKKAPDTEFLLAPGSGNRGVSALRRVIQIPDGTTKVRVFIEAADQPTGSNLGGEVEDGYIVAGLGLTTGPALSLTTTVVSGRDKEAYGFTDDSIYKNEQEGTLEVTLSNRGGLDVSRDTKYKVTVTVPQGVKLGSIQGKDLNEANGFAVFAPSYTTGFRYDKQTRELSFEINIPNRKIEPKTGKTDTVKIPFIVTPDYVGEATFKITGQNGFGGKDTLGNAIYPYGFAPDANRYNLPENFRANSLNTSDNPEYKYNRSIYIDSMTGNSTITVPVGTTFEKAKEAATLSTEELLNSEAYREKLATLKATAALNLSETSLIAMVQGYSTAAVKENSGTLKVPVIHTVGSKNFNNQIDINVNVVASTTQQKVVLEGDIIQNDDIKEKITPATIPGYTATTNNVQNMPTTTGKAGQIINIETTVSYTKGNVVLPETVTVPVLVLPKAKGEVEVHKGASVDKVKEVAKAKATEVATSADFKAKLPERSKDVVVGEITKEVLATITAEKGTNKGIVKVPVTYTVDGTTYTRDAEITVNVLGSEPKTVYTVEGTKPDAKKVKNAVTPGTGGTVNAPKETDLPATTVKAGTPDVTVPTTVTYPTGDETVNVPVEVLPKATPEKVTTLKDTTGENLTTAVKEKAQAALGKLTLPSGVTVELVPNQDYTVPATDSNGDKTAVPVKVQYKDATGTVVADDTINVPVTVVSSTPSKVVVFEGDEVTADAVKGAVTPGTDGTKGTPVIPTDLTKQSGEKEVTLPVAYDGITEPEQVKVPVTVLPKATGEADVPKGSTVDKVKEVAKAKASALVEEAAFKGKLPTGATVTVGDITEEVLATITAEKGTNKGIVNVPATYTVDGKTYNTTVPVTINVLGSEPKTVYTVEGRKPDAEKVKNAVTPGTGGTVNAPKETDLPATTVKAGTPDVTVPTTVTYPTGDETVNVPVEVLPKATPEKVTTLKDTTGENLTTAVKEKAQAALGKLTLPSGVTVELVPNQDYTVPTTDSNGDKGNVPVKVQYKDATGTVVADDTINVPVTVVSSTPSKIVVFEGDEVTADAVKGAVTPGTDGTKGEPTTLPETAGKAGATDVKVDVPVTYDNGKLTETVSVPVIVLPKPEAEEILVAKNSDKEKAKAKVLAKAKKAIEDATFKGKLPQGATVTVDETATITVPDLTEDTEVDVTVKYTVPGEDKPLTTTVKVPVTVVEGVPQIVPVDENNKQPDSEKSIDKTDYPEGSTFRYKTPDGQTSPIDVTTTGDKNVVVEVLDPQGNTIVEVPATVRVVGSTPQFVVADPTKKQPEVKDSVTPGEYPEGTTFEYKTPVDTTTAGEKDVIVIAKLNGQPIAEVPAKVVVVDPKTQYVVADPSKPQPDASKSIDSEQYPEGTTFEYKTPVDTTTPGEKDVVVVAKDGEDKLVEVPTKVKVVQGYPQIVPVDEGKKQPSPEDSIDSNDYPEDATFEYKEEVDTSTPGDKKVTVVVKQGDKVLVEVPSTVRVVESYPKYIPVDPAKKQPDPKENINPNDFPTGTTFEYKDNTPVDTTTPGEKSVTVVAKLNGQSITEIPAKVVVVDPKTQYVVADPSKPQPDASESIDPEQYPEGTTFEYKTPVDTTIPGEKDVVVIAKDGEDKLVEVPTKVRVVQGYPQIVPVDEGKKQPSPEDSIDPNDYPEDATFEYKEEVDTSTPGDKKVTVVVKQGDKVLVEVPSTVRVVESYPKYVPVDPAKKQPDPKENINPNDFPTGTTFEYKDNTPVDTATPGEKDVTVVAKLNGEPITEIPAKIIVVEPKTQYVPVNAENDKKPKPQDSIPPDDYPEGSTFEYKTPEGQTTPYDGTTPGEKDVTVVVKDSDGDPIVEVPAKIKVVQGKEQLTPVNAEDKDKPKAEDSITPSDYPEGSTFEYKIPEGKTEAYDGSTPGDKPVTVVVKDKNGKVLVEVPATIKVVESKPTPIETPVTNTPLTQDDYTKGIKIPEGATVKVGDLPDLTTPGEKTPVKVTIILPNGKSYTVDVPVTVTPVKEIETPVTTDKLTPEDILKQVKVPEGATTRVENIPDLTTPGKKDPVKVTVTLPNGKVVTVEVPVNVTPVKEIETPVTTDKLTPEDILKQVKVPEGATTKVENIPDLTTPGKKAPVKVTVTLPNGKVVTVEVPVNVTPVKEIETPVTTDKLTPEDILKQIKVPEGATTKVENIPDLTTPGKKAPVKVTVELPNGKVITVEVPVNVTPVKPIETPVTTTPFTPEDYTKGITIPEGGKVTKVENIPDLTTPGKKAPVKVTVELPNGKVITVEVPVNVTPVKEIETPVTTDKLTPEDILKQIKVPEGATTKVENIPDLTTPGKKDPVKVTITLPNGKVVTVDVPVNVTPVKEIETPVTTTPLTPEDYTKGITIPEGGKVTKVENIPDLTTPGKKTPVKVTIELPNGKIITVEVPVNVTPVKEIETPVTKDKLTPEDILKQIKVPEGATVEVGDLPDLTTPGKKAPVKVTVTLPNGKVVTVDVPVNVTPVKEIETPVTTDKLTPEDILKQVKVPEGATTKVENIPDLTTPGKKAPVKVTVELPNGKVITVEVPVNVTPVKPIETPVTTTPLTPEDYTKGITIPEGGKVTKVENIPDLTTPGKKAPVKVTVELPNGKVITVEVPVNVTPVKPIETPVTTTPFTPEDYTKGITIPEGGKVTKVENIPDLTTPGKKAPVKVTVELPNGKVITVEVTVTVTPKDTPVKPTIKTKPIVVAVGDPVTKEDVELHIDLPKGAEIVEIGEIPTTETPGQKPSVKVKVKLPSGEIVEVEVSVIVTPKATQTPRPEKPSTTEVTVSPEKAKATVVKEGEKVLPNTGINDSSSPLAGLGLAILGLATLVRRRKQK